MSSKRKSPSRPTLLHVDLKDLKAPWDEWCAGQGLTPSEAFRRLLGGVLEKDASGFRPVPSAAGQGDRSERRRVEIRVEAGQYEAMIAAARSEGMSLPRWLQALILTSLTQRAQYGSAEVEALSRSSQVLLAIGRNLNQIARNMDGRQSGDELTLAQIRFLSDLVKQHTAEVAKVLAANTRRWQ